MAKPDTTDAAAAPEAIELTLEEFCTRLSVTDKRVELIGGFYSSEKRAGRVKDVETAFAGRFVAFATQPA
ncbi:MAG: hypothetical protein AB9M53_00990 [Leptothrix sp. (in: b-proteobacteria)]